MIPISRPSLGSEEHEAVGRVLASGELAQGRWVNEFEEAFAAYCGAKFAVATSSGTTALHLALLAHGIGRGDEVITSPFTFIASSNAILYVGAQPVFADIEPVSFNIDPGCVERAITPRTRALIAIDLYGNPADLPRLAEICKAHGIVLIEDACQAHGAEIDGRRSGSFSTACFSFYPSKNMTTGEGGMITTNDPQIASAARLLRHHGATRPYIHDELGFNFRLTNIQAAIGLVQLQKLPAFNQQRVDNACTYSEQLQDSGVVTPVVRRGARHVFHQYTIRVPQGRDRLQELLKARGVESRVYYPVPVHRQPFYAEIMAANQPPLPHADQAAAEVLSIPVFPGLSPDDVQAVGRAVRSAVDELN